MAVEFTRATMAKLLAILCLGLYLTQGSRAQDFDNCLSIANCFSYFEGSCDTQGRRLVCIQWLSITGCDHDANPADAVCRQNDFASTMSLSANALICTDGTVAGGTDVRFGVDDGVRLLTGSGGPTTINVLGYLTTDGRPPVMCSDYTNVCAASGNNDIELKFRVGECPSTPTPDPPTPMPPNCECDPWVDYGPCTATCGQGTKEQRRTCRNCPPTVPLRQLAPCTVPRMCPPVAMWGIWMQWSACMGPCNPLGTRTRTRLCNNPPPPASDPRPCVGTSTQTAPCFEIPPCGPPITTTPSTGNIQRLCRRAARRRCPRGRRGRACRRMFIRRCIRNGGP